MVCRASSSNALVSAERFLPEFSCLGSAGASPRSASAAPSLRGETGMTTATARALDDRLRAGGFGRERLRGLGGSVGGSAWYRETARGSPERAARSRRARGIAVARRDASGISFRASAREVARTHRRSGETRAVACRPPLGRARARFALEPYSSTLRPSRREGGEWSACPGAAPSAATTVPSRRSALLFQRRSRENTRQPRHNMTIPGSRSNRSPEPLPSSRRRRRSFLESSCPTIGAGRARFSNRATRARPRTVVRDATIRRPPL